MLGALLNGALCCVSRRSNDTPHPEVRVRDALDLNITWFLERVNASGEVCCSRLNL